MNHTPGLAAPLKDAPSPPSPLYLLSRVRCTLLSLPVLAQIYEDHSTYLRPTCALRALSAAWRHSAPRRRSSLHDAPPEFRRLGAAVRLSLSQFVATRDLILCVCSFPRVRSPSLQRPAQHSAGQCRDRFGMCRLADFQSGTPHLVMGRADPARHGRHVGTPSVPPGMAGANLGQP